MHRSSSLIGLATSILTAALCVSSAAQEKAPNSARTGLAIDVDEGRYGLLEVFSSEGGYLQFTPTRKVAESKERRDGPLATGIRIRAVLENGSARVKIGLIFDDSQPVEAPGPKYGEKEEIIASYLAHLGEIVTVKELERFGFKALTLKVVLYQPRVRTDHAPLPLVSAPRVVNELKNVGVVDWKPDSRVTGDYVLILKNLASTSIVAVTVTANSTMMMQAARNKALAKPGDTFEVSMRFGDEMSDPPTAVVVKAVLFDNGSFDGDPEASATMEARRIGREIQLGRFLELLQKTSPAANETQAIALQNLKSAVEEFRIDVDPKIAEGVRARFPLPDEKRAIIPAGIMEGLRLARSHALFMLKDIERKLKENPGAFDLDQSLSAVRDRVAKLVGIQ
jgi:hypothetical protein